MPMVTKTYHDSTAAMIIRPQVTYSDALAPIPRPKRPAMIAPIRGRKTIALYKNIALSALHHIDVFHGDGAAVAVEDDENCETDGRFSSSDGQNEQCEDLADDVIQERRERNHVDVDRKQNKLDR